MIRNNRSRIARLCVAASLLVASLFSALAARAAGGTSVYLPMLSVPGKVVTPTPPTPTPPAGALPSELVGTWFSGQLLNLNYYNRDTGVWANAGGLGHMYVFAANGSYTLVSHLELGGGTTCRSSVSKYHSGTVRAVGGELLLTPSYARTRTVTCGASGSETEGPYVTTRLPWRIGEDQYHHTRLWLSEVQGETEYYKDGLAAQVIGDWTNGDGGAVELYDPASDSWGEPTGANSEWYALKADGSYRHGKIDAGFGSNPCRPVTMTYEQGRLSGSGAQLTLQPIAALRHVVSLCDPSVFADEPLEPGDSERWSWAFNASGETLELMRVSSGFRQLFFVRAE